MQENTDFFYCSKKKRSHRMEALSYDSIKDLLNQCLACGIDVVLGLGQLSLQF